MRQETDEIVREVMKSRGRTFADEIGIDLSAGHPDALFELLNATLLFSVRVGWKVALSAAQKLHELGWTTPQRVAGTTREGRVRAFDDARYVRYDESRSRMMGTMAGMVLDRYGGSLENLREKAGRNPARERELLREFPGIGPTGADIFCREVQAVWNELYPFVDAKAVEGARQLGLPSSAGRLAALAPRGEFPSLVAALVRVALDKPRRKELAGV